MTKMNELFKKTHYTSTILHHFFQRSLFATRYAFNLRPLSPKSVSMWILFESNMLLNVYMNICCIVLNIKYSRLGSKPERLFHLRQLWLFSSTLNISITPFHIILVFDNVYICLYHILHIAMYMWFIIWSWLYQATHLKMPH